MSKLKTNTIENLTGTYSTSADNVINGCAKAWVNFNGTGTIAIRQGYNVSSIIDNGVGDYTVNFTTALADTNYALCGSSTVNNTAGGDTATSADISGNQITTSSIRIYSYYPQDGTNTAVRVDSQFNSIIIFR